MPDPHEILGIPSDADETCIRNRYLELVRQHPPEQDGERFAQIRSAYEALRDPVVRLTGRLFPGVGHESLDDIVDDVTQRFRTARIPTDRLLELAERS